MLAFVKRNAQALINLGLWIIFFWLLYFALTRALPYITPLLLGVLFAILLEPIVKLLHKLRIPRGVSALTTILITFGGGLALLTLLGARLAIELGRFSSRIPELTSGMVAQGQELLHRAIAFYGTLSPTMTEKMRENFNRIADALTNFGSGIVSSVLGWLANVPSTITIFIISLLIAFFISKDFPLWKTRILRFVNPSIQEKGSIVLDDLGRAIFGYTRAQAILITITFAQVLIGLLILGVDYAFSLSLLAAVLDILPLLGTGSLFVPWAIYLLIVGNVKLAVGLLIVYGLIVAVRQILEPKILADSIGLDPLFTIVMMYAGYHAVGFLGVILAPFLLILFVSLIKVQAFHFLVDPDHSDEEKGKILW
ncbi:MAG: sporulation integral membrane protein YtvI [Tumebacillaceae bacterium]